MTAGVRTCIAGDRLRIGQCVRLCRIDGQVYPLRPNRPRRKPWKLLGVVASSAVVGVPVKIMCSGK